jgi:hypothetical protein
MCKTLARLTTPRDLLEENSILYIKVDSSDLREISGDTFARVANVQDITALYHDRTSAVMAKATEYLTSTITLIYDNIVTSNAAYKTLLNRLSLLETEYQTYQQTFSTNPYTDYTLPQTDISVEAEYVNAYKIKKAITLTAKATRDAAETAKKTCELGCIANKTILDFLITDISFLEKALQIVTSLNETGSLVGGTYTVAPSISFNNIVKTYCLNVSDPTSFAALLAAKRVQFDQYRLLVEQCNVNCRSLSASLIDAEQQLVNAQREEDTALNRVLVVCPTFDPTTI